MPNNETNTFYRNGKRFSSTPVDLDALAQAQGYDNFSAMQEQSPQLAQQLANENGGDNPGQTYQQGAAKDDIDWKKIGLIMAGTVGGGALASYLGGAGAAGAGIGAGASAGAAPVGATVAGAPVVTGLGTGATLAGGAALPGAASIGVPAAVKTAGMLAGGKMLDMGVKAGAGIANSLLEKRQQDQARAQRDRELAENARQFDQTQAQRQAEQALNATQLDPFKQARGSQLQALLNAVSSRLSPVSYSGGKISGGISGALNPTALGDITRQTSPDSVRSNMDAFNALVGKLKR